MPAEGQRRGARTQYQPGVCLPVDAPGRDPHGEDRQCRPGAQGRLAGVH